MQTLLSCAQTVFPLNSPDAPSGSYTKDMYHEFDPYLGIWQGTWDNKQITFYLTKVEHVPTTELGNQFFYRDKVIAKYKVVDLNTGLTIEDTTNITDINSIDLIASTINRTKNFLRFFYSGGNSRCGLSADVFMYRDLNNANMLTYKYYVNGGMEEWWNGQCSYTDIDLIPVPIPKVPVVLHKL